MRTSRSWWRPKSATWTAPSRASNAAPPETVDADGVDLTSDQRKGLSTKNRLLEVGGPEGPARSRNIAQIRLSLGQVDQLDVGRRESGKLERRQYRSKRFAPHEVDLVVHMPGHTDAPTGQVTGRPNAGRGESHDGLILIDPRRPDESGVGATAATPNGRRVATFTKRVRQTVIEVRLTYLAARRLAQRTDIDSVWCKLVLEPAKLDRDARCRRHRTPRVPERVDLHIVQHPILTDSWASGPHPLPDVPQPRRSDQVLLLRS